jgi:hypothetical protein
MIKVVNCQSPIGLYCCRVDLFLSKCIHRQFVFLCYCVTFYVGCKNGKVFIPIQSFFFFRDYEQMQITDW